MAKKKRKPSKMEEMMERYGPAAFVTWFGIFFSTIALFYALLTLGVDLDALVLRVVGWWGSDGSTWQEWRAGAEDHWLGFLGAKLVVSYLGAQVVKPLRIGLFAFLTPVVARFMGREEAAEPPAPEATVEAETSVETEAS